MLYLSLELKQAASRKSQDSSIKQSRGYKSLPHKLLGEAARQSLALAGSCR